MPLGLGLGISKIKSLVSGLRVRFQGNATITAALDGILRDLSADFVSNGTVTAALEAIKLLDVDFSGEGTLTADLASFEGLLDTYSGAAAAYSIRLLSSTYSGALVEIRRSSDNALKSFYPDSNNELSLSSEDGASTTLSSWIGSDNGFIRTWFDQSGNANNATLTSAAAQHQIINTGVLITDNAKAAADGQNKQGYLLNTTINNVKSLIAVGRKINDETFNYISGTITGTITGYYVGFGANNLLGVFNGSTGVNSAETLTDDTQGIIQFYHQSGGNIGCAINDNVISDTTEPSTTAINIDFVFGRNLDFLTLSGKEQELIIYTTDQSANKTGITTNQNSYYSIY